MRQAAVVLSWLERGQALGGFFIQSDNLGFRMVLNHLRAELGPVE